MTFSRRLLAACFVALATWLGLCATSIAAVESPPLPVAVHPYHNQQHFAPTPDATGERGPPAVYDPGTIYHAVGSRSYGVSARPDGPTPTPTSHRTTSPMLVQVARATTTTGRQIGVTDGDLSALPGARVAAKKQRTTLSARSRRLSTTGSRSRLNRTS